MKPADLGILGRLSLIVSFLGTFFLSGPALGKGSILVIKHIKKFKQTVFGKPVAFGSREHLHALISKSELFDYDWYLAKYPDVAGHFKWATDPVSHYLRHGASEGRNPSEAFKTNWYLRENPDVQQSGMNPLVHYILHGMEEGRLPYAKARKRDAKVNLNRVETLRAKLWSGFARYALPMLEHKAGEEQRNNASWHLAAWYYAHGNYNRALAYIEQSIAQSDEAASRRKLVAQIKCLSQQKQLKPLQQLLANPDARQQLARLLPYAEANKAGLANDTAGQLAAINRLFAQSDLSAVLLRDDTKAVELANLQADELVPAVGSEAKVSVIIPAYNAAHTIGIALHSLTQQTWQNLEILVVDDASTDNTAAVIKQWCQQDKRIRYLANPHNMGAYPSRNNGMSQATGDFITVHDSDDWSHPQKIARQLAPMLENPAVKATYSSWVRVLPDMTFVGSWYLNDVFVEKNHSSLLLRRSTLNKTGLWDAVNVAADTEFMWRLEHHFGQDAIKHIMPEAPLSFALSDDSSLTRTKASHVKTIHFGLRRLYREASRWWHRQSENGGYMDAAQRPFPLPLGIVRGSPRKFDSLLVADFASATKDKLAEILAEAERRVAANEQLCFFHWPRFKRFHGAEIQDEVFAFCQQHGVQFAHAGIEIACPLVVMAGQRLTAHIPDQVVAVTSVKTVVDLSGDELPEQQGWCRFWHSGAEVEAPTELAPTATELPEAPPIASLYAKRTVLEPFSKPQWQRDNRQFVEENLYKNGFIAALDGAQSALTANADIAHWVKLEWADWHICLQNEQQWQCFGNRLALIGTAFDAYNKIFDPQRLLQHLAGKLSNETAFLNALDNLSGKFVLLIRHDDGWKLYNDAFSSRSIFYHDEHGGLVASHAALLADAVNARVDNDCLTFIQHADFKARDVKYLPGRRTLYCDLYYCPANHRFVMAEHTTERYWPRAGTKIDPDAGQSLIQYLDGYGDYIKQHYDQEFFGLTAGMDSRVLFSLMIAKGMPMQVFTMLRGDPSGGSKADMQMAKAMCAHFSLPHREVRVDFKRLGSNSFTPSMQVLRANTGHMRGNAMIANSQFSDEFGPELHTVRTSYSRGFGGEIMRGFYHRQGPATAKHFASLYGLMAGSAYVQDSFEHFAKCSDFSQTHGISVNDLYYWEHRMSGWAALGVAETDLFADTFAGYNSRRLYEAFMRESPEQREAREGFKAAIRHYCPTLLEWEFA